MIDKLIRHALVAIGAASALVVATSTPASAALNTTRYWSNNGYVGYCSQIQGGYVLAAQAFLWGKGYYGVAVDNVWGDKSHLALGNYQRNNGLSIDSCAGPATWDNMQRKLVDMGPMTNPRYDSTSSGRYAWFSYAKPTLSGTCRWSSYTRSPSNYPRGTAVTAVSYDFDSVLRATNAYHEC